MNDQLYITNLEYYSADSYFILLSTITELENTFNNNLIENNAIYINSTFNNTNNLGDEYSNLYNNLEKYKISKLSIDGIAFDVSSGVNFKNIDKSKMSYINNINTQSAFKALYKDLFGKDMIIKEFFEELPSDGENLDDVYTYFRTNENYLNYLICPNNFTDSNNKAFINKFGIPTKKPSEVISSYVADIKELKEKYKNDTDKLEILKLYSLYLDCLKYITNATSELDIGSEGLINILMQIDADDMFGLQSKYTTYIIYIILCFGSLDSSQPFDNLIKTSVPLEIEYTLAE